MPGTPTTPDGLRWPVDTDSPDIPRDFKNLADDTQAALNKKGGVFANAAARDAYFTTAPPEGTSVWLADKEYFTYYHDGQWIYAYGMHIRRDTDVALTSAAPYKVVWETVGTLSGDFTPFTWTAADGFVIPKSGMWKLQIAVAVTPSVTSTFWFQVLEDGVVGIATTVPMITGFQNQPIISETRFFPKGKKIGLQVLATAPTATLLAVGFVISSSPLA